MTELRQHWASHEASDPFARQLYKEGVIPKSDSNDFHTIQRRLPNETPYKKRSRD